MDAFITIVTKKINEKTKESFYYYVTNISEQQRITLHRTYFQNFFCSNTAAAEYILFNTLYKQFPEKFDYKISNDLNHPNWDNIHPVNMNLSEKFTKDLNFIFHYIEVE